MVSHHKIGHLCEKWALIALMIKGYLPVGMNVVTGRGTGAGEIDLIVANKRYLVFVEVKLRRSADFARACEFVDARKQERLRTTASRYLSDHPTDLQPRFDVIEIYAPDGINTKNPTIYHMEDAFQ